MSGKKTATLLLLLISQVFVTAKAQQTTAVKRPNIILILSDDLGYSDIGPFGSEIPTPNLDNLAKTGLRFAQFYNHARCCPTRASLMTGLDNHQVGVGSMVDDSKKDKENRGLYGYSGKMNFDCVTLAEVLKSAGYHTYMTGKWHLGAQTSAYYPTNRGFEKYYGFHGGGANYFHPKSIFLNDTEVPITDPDYYTTNAFTDYAINFMKEQKDDKPFFLYLAYNAAHLPLLAREEDKDKVKGLYDKGWDVVRNNRFEKVKQSGLVPNDLILSAEAMTPWLELPKEKQKQEIGQITTYAAMIYNMDKNIGRVTDYLKASGKLDNTLIIYLSDNGATFHTEYWNMCNSPFTGHKRDTYEGGIAAHCIVSWPKVITGQQGKITQSPADVIDIMPTVLQVSGAVYPTVFNKHKIQPLEGHSLVQVFKEGTRKEPEWFFWEHDDNYAVKNLNWKAVKPNNSKNWKLYNIQNDRGETKDLAAAYPAVLAQLTAQWKKWADAHYVFPKGESRSDSTDL
jgi:arylsulfatase A-like enzyme